MTITGIRVLLACAALLLAGCAHRVPEASDGGGDVSVAPVTTTPAPVTTTAVPSAPSSAPCASEVVAAPAQTGTPTAAPGGGSVPDVAPHQAENNGWKQRRALTPDERTAGEDAARRIAPLLVDLCARGDFTAEGTRRALVGAGFPSDAIVEVVPQPEGVADSSPVVFYNMTLAARTCVQGDLRLGRVRVHVDGPTGEGSCYEPKTH
jgi:hypothetical protein